LIFKTTQLALTSYCRFAKIHGWPNELLLIFKNTRLAQRTVDLQMGQRTVDLQMAQRTVDLHFKHKSVDFIKSGGNQTPKLTLQNTTIKANRSIAKRTVELRPINLQMAQRTVDLQMPQESVDLQIADESVDLQLAQHTVDLQIAHESVDLQLAPNCRFTKSAVRPKLFF